MQTHGIETLSQRGLSVLSRWYLNHCFNPTIYILRGFYQIKTNCKIKTTFNLYF